MFITSQMPKSVSAEAYRSLRTAIKFSSADKPLKTIVITSSVPNEGKTTIAGNLAIALSATGGKVLLIDCDLRNPSLHKWFSLKNDLGLTNLLVEKTKLEDCINVISSKLSFVSAGTIPPNPSEIIGSRIMEAFLKEMSIVYDYIIIDTPPVIPVTDGQLLAAKVDATILVVRAKNSKSNIVLQGYKELEKVKANVIGSILNNSDEKKNSKYYKYYGDHKKKWFKRK